MKRTIRLVLVLLPICAVAGSAQRTSPRTPDGRPDFQGTYGYDTLTPFERPAAFVDKPFLTDAEASDFVAQRVGGSNADRRASDPLTDLLRSVNEFWFERPTTILRIRGRNLTSRIVDPPDGRMPGLTPAAQQRVAAIMERRRLGSADGPEDRGVSERCLSPAPMISIGGEANFLQIVQTPDDVVMYTELLGVRRIIPIGRETRRPASIRSRVGSSLARWDGDTLVVETTNFTGAFDFAFAAIDENLHLTERLSQLDADTLLYEATIDDPTAFVRPWTSVLALRRTDARMFEFACHEGNYALANILRGARAEERGRADGSR